MVLLRAVEADEQRVARERSRVQEQVVIGALALLVMGVAAGSFAFQHGFYLFLLLPLSGIVLLYHSRIRTLRFRTLLMRYEFNPKRALSRGFKHWVDQVSLPQERGGGILLRYAGRVDVVPDSAFDTGDQRELFLSYARTTPRYLPGEPPLPIKLDPIELQGEEREKGLAKASELRRSTSYAWMLLAGGQGLTVLKHMFALHGILSFVGGVLVISSAVFLLSSYVPRKVRTVRAAFEADERVLKEGYSFNERRPVSAVWAWSDVTEVRETETGILLRLKKEGEVHLPNDAFTSAAQRARLLRLALERHRPAVLPATTPIQGEP
jgi:hypothetical protein